MSIRAKLFLILFVFLGGAWYYICAHSVTVKPLQDSVRVDHRQHSPDLGF